MVDLLHSVTGVAARPGLTMCVLGLVMLVVGHPARARVQVSRVPSDITRTSSSPVADASRWVRVTGSRAGTVERPGGTRPAYTCGGRSVG